jgi:hypothetical protein
VCVCSGCECDHPRLFLEKPRRASLPLRVAKIPFEPLFNALSHDGLK